MARTHIINSLNTGEMSPKLWGRVDLIKSRNAATTMRNFCVDYRGGAFSRAGTAYCGMCKQDAPNAGGTATSNPPRLIPFQFNINQGYALEFGDQYMRILSEGEYVTEAAQNITNVSQANPAVVTIAAHGYSNGDWVYVTGVVGMTNLNGLVYVVQGVTTNTFTLTDLFGNIISSLSYPAYVSGGTAARIYTPVSPYAAVDLPYLKFTQSADVVSLTCVNIVTGTEYPPYDLARLGNTNWTFTAVTFATDILPPTGLTASAQNSTTTSTNYNYVVTAVDISGNQESVASAPVTVFNNDISIFAGSNTLKWNPVSNAGSYNIYEATPSYSGTGAFSVNIGAPYGLIGNTLGLTFTDTNIVPDFTQTPPLHNNPFAPATVTNVIAGSGGSGYSQSTATVGITTSTGSGFIGTPIVINGSVADVLIQNGGQNYAPTDRMFFSGGSASASATIVLGPALGTYPSTVAYYEQRRVYGDTQNEPDTYFMSQTGAFLNMDASTPTIDSDAIIGSPWALQINGRQFFVPMQAGLIVFTGNSAWLLNGGTSAAITPIDQTAVAQSYNGCSNTVPPIAIDYDILYVQSKSSIICDFSYNFFINVFTGTDRTTQSSQLFDGHSIVQWAWAREPNKIVWIVRDDGILLSLTYFKEVPVSPQLDVCGFARHDTNGIFKSVCSIIELPPTNVGPPVETTPLVDAVYFVVQRYVNGEWVYYSERLNDRIWFDSEDCWCVDAALGYPQTYPNATLQASAASGTGVTFTAGSSVFTSGSVGSVIRTGGGIATVTAYVSGTVVTGSITQTIAQTVPNDPNNTPVPQAAGTWTITVPTSIINGLNHLEGLTVTGLADGNVIPPAVVTNNSITLQQPASSIVIGLPYLPQLQTMYLDPPDQEGTVQTKRKTINSVGIRMVNTRGISVGTNQVDASTQQNSQNVPWSNLIEIKQNISTSNPTNSIPLFTGDYFMNVQSGWDERAQVAIQQNYPLPAGISAVVAYFSVGDN